MHATLDADFVVAWTRFCVAFVEKFGQDYERFGRPYFDGAKDWREGLERLIQAQNSATIDDLIEIMADEAPAVLGRSSFQTLINHNHRNGAELP